MEISLRQGNGDIFKGIQSPQVGTEGRPLHPLVERLVNALPHQTLRFLLDGRRDCTGILAVAAGIQIGNARHHLKTAAEAGVDQSFVVEPQIQRAGVAQQNIAGHIADQGQAHIFLTVLCRPALEARQELGTGNLHRTAGLLLRHGIRLVAVISGDHGAALTGQNPVRQIQYMPGIHITNHGQNHIGRRIERLMAVIQGFRRNMGNTLHRTGNAGTGRTSAVERLQHPGIDLPVGVVLDHTDLLSDDALLLGHALLREIGNRHKGQQDFQILLKVVGRIEIVTGHGVCREGVGFRAVLGQFLQGVALLCIEHLVFQIVSDAGRRIQPLTLQLETGVHTAVAGGKEGIFLAVARLGNHKNSQSVGQRFLIDRFTDAFVKHLLHASASFPRRK